MTIQTTGKAKYIVKTQAEIDAINAAYDESISQKGEDSALRALDDSNLQTEW